MHLLYALASYLLFLALLPVLLWHPKLRHGLRHRLGLYPASLDLVHGRTGPRVHRRA